MTNYNTPAYLRKHYADSPFTRRSRFGEAILYETPLYYTVKNIATGQEFDCPQGLLNRKLRVSAETIVYNDGAWVGLTDGRLLPRYRVIIKRDSTATEPVSDGSLPAWYYGLAVLLFAALFLTAIV